MHLSKGKKRSNWYGSQQLAFQQALIDATEIAKKLELLPNVEKEHVRNKR